MRANDISYTFSILSKEKTVIHLTILRLVFTYVNGCRKIPLQIHFIYLGNKETYCIFKICSIISILFSTKCHLLNYFIFFCYNNTTSINNVLKFKNPPQYDKH